MSRTSSCTLATLLTGAALWSSAPAAAAPPEDELRASWVGRWVVLRTAALSDCDERYTNNRMQGPRPKSSGRHRFDPGELGRVDMLHLKRARIDLLVSLAEPLRVELRDGPFQLYEQLDCRVELEVPAPREAVRRGDIEQLDALLEGLLEALASRVGVDGSPLWNRRRVEPLPADHEERLAAYLVWKEEQLYLATRDRLAEALDRAASIVERVDRSASYAQGVMEGVRASRRDRFASTSCEELPGVRFSASYHSAPEELDDRDARDWKDGFEDGQQLRFETALARRLERCLP